MRRLLILGASMAAILSPAIGPADARTVSHPPAAAAKHSLPVGIAYFQHSDSARLNIAIGNLPTPEVRNNGGELEIRLATTRPLRITEYHQRAHEVAGIQTRVEDGHAVIVLRLACDCDVKSSRGRKIFSLTLRDGSQTAANAPAENTSAPGDHKNEMQQLREELTAKLTQLNAPPAVSKDPSPSSQPGAGQTAEVHVAAAPPLPACAPVFDGPAWKGQGDFHRVLTALRQTAAKSHEAAPDMARLAEFYLGYGLAGEARDAARIALEADPPPADPDRLRLLRDADMASLLKGDPIDAKSPLLAEGTGCERTDIPLWRALAAASAHDPVGVLRDVHAASLVLPGIPEPLLQAFDFRLAEAARDNVAALRDLAAAVRNAGIGDAADEAARFLLQARIAGAAGDTVDEVVFLKRAAEHSRSLPGLAATERLAELGLAAAAPSATHDEMVLADMARVYRGTRLGGDAAAALAENRLRQGDQAGALRIADEAASPNGVRGADSRGAAIAARILRMLLADPSAASLPEPTDRVALYLKYDGYATPGEAGDDIRLGAARLMLDQDMASAALDVVHQLSDRVAATPEGKAMRAVAEARAGDPAVALLLVRDLPPSQDTKRTSADALARMGRPADAAHQLDGLTELADRTRRAALLGQASAWGDAAAAYADLLRDSALSPAARKDAAERYAFALALSGRGPDHSLIPAGDDVATRTVAALPHPGGAAAATALSLPVMQDAVARARQIETLLPPAEANKGS